MSFRIIPRLEIKGPSLVKGVNLEGLRVLGRPEEFARFYYETGADELLYQDVVASLYGRNSLLDIVERTAREIFIPLTVGGGLRSIDDIRRVLRSGADKVSINTAALKDPPLISDAAMLFGSSTIVVSIEAKLQRDGSYEAYVDGGRERTGIEVFEWASRAVELGAGELLIMSIDREGTGAGLDLELIRRIAEAVHVPVIAAGGGGSASDVVAAAVEGKADAIALSSMLHYHYLKNQASSTDNSHLPGLGNTRRAPARINDCSIDQLKLLLGHQNVMCRPFSETAYV